MYNRLEDCPPSYESFRQLYGEHFGAYQAGDLCPDGDQLHCAARTARPEAAAGRDGWKPAELALLPSAAWQARARLHRAVKTKGRWPKAYYEVNSPCLRKSDRLDPEGERGAPTILQHRLLSIYSQLYRIEMGAWCHNHIPWLAQVVHPASVGAMKGRECAESSWDAQAFLETAINLKQEGVVALLDYYKFFDSFDPRFFGPL